MIKINQIYFFLFLLLAAGFAGSCVKQDFDRPPINSLPVGDVYTIGQLIEMLNTTGATQFNKDASVYGVVTMDETSGNIYRSAYIQDETGAINMRLKEAGGLRVGDSIRVYLKNVVLSSYNNMRQLDNVHNDSNIVIIANQKYRQPETVTLSDILTGNYQAKLVKFENVQFIAGDTSLTYSSSDATTNRNIEDCDGKTMIIRTSNFANFAGKNLPNGNGSLTAVVGLFNTTWQLYVRTATEVQMEGNRCGSGGGGGNDPVDGINQNFDGVTADVDISFNGWANIAEAGTRRWQGKVYQGNGYAQASGYNSNLSSMVTWLITPPVKMDQQKYLNFKTAKAFWAHDSNDPLTVMVSSNFDGVNVAAATWTPINATLATQSSGDNAWVESGDIDLSAFIPEGQISIAFKYVGSGTQSTSYRIDDVYVGTEPGGGGGGGGGGDAGTIDNPYTVEQAIENQNANPYVVGWVSGYIVGSVKNGVTSITSADDIHWAAPFSSATNVLIASSSSETNYNNCVIVNLPAGTPLRTDVNLLDNPDNLGKQLKVTGTLRTYFGVAGLRDAPGQAGDYVFDGSGGGGGGGTGSGTQTDPYNVAQAVASQNATPYVVGWVKGYIVGSVKSGVSSITSADDIHWSAPFTSPTNVLIADSKTETDYTKCVIVNLPAGSPLRTQVNLLDNPDNFQKWLNVTGTLRTYFGVAGLRDAPGQSTDFELEGGGGGGGGDALFTENFDSNLGTFSAISIIGTQAWDWGNFDGGCALMTGFSGGSSIENEDWLISPAVDLSTNTGSILNVRQAANYVAGEWSLLQVMISSDYDGSSNPNTQGTWTELQVPNMPSGTNWTFVDSGDIDISDYDGESTVYVAFRYRSSTSVSSTWEISKVEIK